MCHESNVLMNDGKGDSIFTRREDITVTNIEAKDLVVSKEIQWIHALTTAVVGLHVNLIPVVHAAPPPQEPPSRPPAMRYKELPIYESPHYEYKDYVEDSHKCPHRNVKLLQTMLFPIVHSFRSHMGNKIWPMVNELNAMKNESTAYLCRNYNDFIKYMRCPSNIDVRRAVVGSAALTGFYLGFGKRGIMRKLIFATLGALAGGALCFPKETDEIVRESSFKAASKVISLFNSLCSQNIEMRERLPCPDDLPPPPQALKPEQKNKRCDEKKK